MGSESTLVSVIFINMEIKIRKSLQISTKFNTKPLFPFFFASKILENIAAYRQN